MYGNGIIDQLDDMNFDRLPEMILRNLPGGIFEHNIDPIMDLLPLLFRQGSAPHMIMMSSNPEPEMDTKVIDTPNGKIIIKSMRSSNARMAMGGNQVEQRMCNPMAYSNHFPTTDPMQALMSYLFAKTQEGAIGEHAVNQAIRPEVAKVTGEGAVNDVDDFFNKIKNFLTTSDSGTETFDDPELHRKVTVTIDNFADAAGEANEVDEAKVGKEAALKAMALLDNPYHGNRKVAILKSMKKVQTALPKLAFVLEAYNHYEPINRFINLLKLSMMEDRYLTIANKQAQNQLLEKLSEILKGEGEDVQPAFVEDMIYNTDLSDDEGEIIHIDGYPIDLEKLKGISYKDASKALTATIADAIFNDEKTQVDVDKFEKFMKNIVENQDSDVEKEEVKDRIVDPILLNFKKAEAAQFVEYQKAIMDKYGIDIADFEDTISGGKSDGKTITDYPLDQILKGMEVEKEHTTNPMQALEITCDHLEEFPDYYDRLAIMEDQANAAANNPAGEESEEEKAESTGRPLTSELVRKIHVFLSTHKDLEDSDFHEFATGLGLNPHQAEEVVYRFAQGMVDAAPEAAAKVPTDVEPEEKTAGLKVPVVKASSPAHIVESAAVSGGQVGKRGVGRPKSPVPATKQMIANAKVPKINEKTATISRELLRAVSPDNSLLISIGINPEDLR